MFEFLICSSVTILPDLLLRRYLQGKRIGHEINLYSMWYELRYGITGCAILTVSLVTVIFYFHPSTTNVTSFFRTVTILPDANGRVTAVFAKNGEAVKAGQELFKLDDRVPQAAYDAARAKLKEIEANLSVGQAQLAAAEGQVDQARSALKQAQDELDTRQQLLARNSSAVTTREVETLQNTVAEREGALEAAMSSRDAVSAELTTLLPAQRETAEANLNKAQTDLDNTVVRAGVDGQLEQFALQVGDYVNTLVRPAGILVPTGNLGLTYQAGFNQMAAQVIRPGMLAEITCMSQPFAIIPMVVSSVQPVIAAGQYRPSDRLVDASVQAAPGSLLVYLQPLYAGQAEPIPPGSTCIGNAYTDNRERLHDNPDLGTLQRVALHTVDTVGIVHAFLLRIQALLLPVRTLVFTGHH